MLCNFVSSEHEADVSVIILTYNHEKYIECCLDSVLSQKFDFKTEIIIGDDCSSDGTQQILIEYKKKYPFLQLVLRQTNIGATKNAYDLSMRMRGKYYAYLEGDDFWCNDNKLRIQYDFLLRNPDLVGCCHKSLLVDAFGRKIHKSLYWASNKKHFSLKDFNGIKIPGHSSSWMRKNLYAFSSEDISAVFKFNKNIGDRTVALIFLSHGDFALINKKMSAYRYIRKKNGGSLTNTVYSGVSAYATEYEMAEKFEEYSREHLNKIMDLEKRKNQIICDVLIFWLRKQDQEAKKLLEAYIGKSRNRLRTYVSIPVNFLRKIVLRLFFAQ